MSWLRNLSLSAKRNRRSVFFSLWSVDENAVGDWFPRASEKCSSIRLMKLQKLNVHVQKMRTRKTLILIFLSFISFKEIKNLILVYCKGGSFYYIWFTCSIILAIGKKIEATMVPTIAATNIINSGSIIDIATSIVFL